MDFKTENMPATRIAYIRRTGPYGAGNVQTMDELKAWAKDQGLLDDDAVILGIARDDPRTTKPEDCRYDTCIAISDNQPVTGDSVRADQIAGGNYAIFEVEHTAEAVRKAWDGIFPELSSRGCQLDTGRLIVERYAARLIREHRCEICVPVK